MISREYHHSSPFLFVFPQEKTLSYDDLTSQEKRQFNKFKAIAERRGVVDETGVQEVVKTLTSPAMLAIPVLLMFSAFAVAFFSVYQLNSGDSYFHSAFIAFILLWIGIQNYRTITVVIPKIADAYLETLPPRKLSKGARKKLLQRESVNDS